MSSGRLSKSVLRSRMPWQRRLRILTPPTTLTKRPNRYLAGTGLFVTTQIIRIENDTHQLFSLSDLDLYPSILVRTTWD